MEVWGGTAAADNGVVMPGLDAWVFARPFQRDAEGGDIHYLSSCATGRVVRLLLADVAGHGSSVADLAGRLRKLMRRYLNYVDQSALVAEVNREFGRLASDGRFATAIVATCWTPTRRVSLTNAGHPPPLHYSARRDRWAFLTNDPGSRPTDANPLRNIPLGIASAAYDEHRLRLDEGDLLMVYTDALIEAKSSSGALLGSGGLLAIIERLDPTDPQRLIADLRHAIRAHTDDADEDDDLTIMILRPNDLRPRASIATGLVAGGRLAKDLGRSIRGKGPFAMPEINVQNIAGAFFDRLNRRSPKE
jgi:serine phosphatase RsbU (regulator of sigma subunit)